MTVCEVCGTKIVGEELQVEIDGATLVVCARCAKLGKPVKQLFSVSSPSHANPGRVYRKPEQIIADDSLIVREDFPAVIRNTRTSMGLTQEQLGMKVNEKSSVIAKLETGRLKPSIQLARKLENLMKIHLLEREESP